MFAICGAAVGRVRVTQSVIQSLFKSMSLPFPLAALAISSSMSSSEAASLSLEHFRSTDKADAGVNALVEVISIVLI